MKHPIYTQTVEYFGEGNNITEYRPNWFEAVFSEDYEPGNDNRGKNEVDPTVGTGDRPSQTSKPKRDLPAINDIP